MVKKSRLWDPLYGRIDLSDYEYSLIILPEIQRLRYIRMCNINSLLVTGASEISRFEHTIGVLRLAQEWISHNKVLAPDADNIRAAAVLHDMQTGPFGHSLQYVLEDNKTDDNFIHDDIMHGVSKEYHQDISYRASFSGKPFEAPAILGNKITDISRIIQGEGPFGPLISGTIDLDNIDNVFRLAYHVGVATKEDGQIALNLSKEINIGQDGLSISSTAIDYILRWQAVRTRLYELLLLDWAEFAAKAMLTRAIEEAIQGSLLGSDSWLDTDDQLLDYLEKQSTGELQDISELIRRLKRGDLYHPVALLESPNIDKYEHLTRTEIKRDFESEIILFARNTLKLGIKVIVHYILDNKKTNRSIIVKLKESGETKIIGTDSKKLLIGLFISKESTSKDIDMLFNKATEIWMNLGIEIDKLAPIEDPMGIADTVKGTGKWFQQSLPI